MGLFLVTHKEALPQAAVATAVAILLQVAAAVAVVQVKAARQVATVRLVPLPPAHLLKRVQVQPHKK